MFIRDLDGVYYRKQFTIAYYFKLMSRGWGVNRSRCIGAAPISLSLGCALSMHVGCQ